MFRTYLCRNFFALLTNGYSDYKFGGLNLNAGHFAQLSMFFVYYVARRLLTSLTFLSIVALMCLAQIAYQFYLYPYVHDRFRGYVIAHVDWIYAEILGTSSCRLIIF